MVAEGVPCQLSPSNGTDASSSCCQCREGMVRDDVTFECKPVSECGCEMDGVRYEPGETVKKGKCGHCTCVDARMRCSSYCTIERCASGMRMNTDDEGCCYCLPGQLPTLV